MDKCVQTANRQKRRREREICGPVWCWLKQFTPPSIVLACSTADLCVSLSTHKHTHSGRGKWNVGNRPLTIHWIHIHTHTHTINTLHNRSLFHYTDRGEVKVQMQVPAAQFLTLYFLVVHSWCNILMLRGQKLQDKEIFQHLKGHSLLAVS